MLTLPLGGFVNHSVQVFKSGCLTLKFSGSWNTVLISLSAPPLAEEVVLVLPTEPSDGDMGIVSSGTCCCGFGAATSAMVSA